MAVSVKSVGPLRVTLSCHVPLKVRVAVFALRIYAFFGGRFDLDRVTAWIEKSIRVFVK